MRKYFKHHKEKTKGGVGGQGNSGNTTNDLEIDALADGPGLSEQREQLDSGYDSVRSFTTSNLHRHWSSCKKHPHHDHFIPIKEFNWCHLPKEFQSEDWVKLIQLKAVDTVRLKVKFTSPGRPESLALPSLQKGARHGSGTAFLFDMKKREPCCCQEKEGIHYVSGVFKVMTAAHVVFSDEEARSTTVEFFYDSTDKNTVVKGRGVRVCHLDVEGNRAVIECITHDLNLYENLENARVERERLIREKLEPVVNGAQMVVLISHPHGSSKHVSVGRLMNMTQRGTPKRTRDNMQLVDCTLVYNTPTCPGSGGGSINLFGGGTTNAAFTLHCASKANGENISGLGWAFIGADGKIFGS